MDYVIPSIVYLHIALMISFKVDDGSDFKLSNDLDESVVIILAHYFIECVVHFASIQSLSR